MTAPQGAFRVFPDCPAAVFPALTAADIVEYNLDGKSTQTDGGSRRSKP